MVHGSSFEVLHSTCITIQCYKFIYFIKTGTHLEFVNHIFSIAKLLEDALQLPNQKRIRMQGERERDVFQVYKDVYLSLRPIFLVTGNMIHHSRRATYLTKQVKVLEQSKNCEETTATLKFQKWVALGNAYTLNQSLALMEEKTYKNESIITRTWQAFHHHLLRYETLTSQPILCWVINSVEYLQNAKKV